VASSHLHAVHLHRVLVAGRGWNETTPGIARTTTTTIRVVNVVVIVVVVVVVVNCGVVVVAAAAVGLRTLEVGALKLPGRDEQTRLGFAIRLSSKPRQNCRV